MKLSTIATLFASILFSVEGVKYEAGKAARDVQARQQRGQQAREGTLGNGRETRQASVKVVREQNPNVCENTSRKASKVRQGKKKPGKSIYGGAAYAKTVQEVGEEAEKAAAQFIPPGRNDQGIAENPGYAWQQPTVTHTVTRGFDRTTVFAGVNYTNTVTQTNTVIYEQTQWDTVLVPIESTTTETNIQYETVYETVAVGPISTIEDHTTVTQQETVTVTLTEGPVATYQADVTVWETAWHTQVEYTADQTSTSTVFFPDTTILHNTSTVTQQVEGGPETVYETVTVDVTGITTVQDVITVTDVDIVYETPAFY